MGESAQYFAASLRDIEDTVLGRARNMDTALRVLINDIRDNEAREVARHMMTGQSIDWDTGRLRGASWETLASVSGFFAGVVRLFGTAVGFDAWPEHQRVLLTISDWSPLPPNFGLALACRPFPFIRFNTDLTASPVPRIKYVEAWPHGYIERSEFAAAVPAMHALLLDMLQPPDEHALASVAPGAGFPSSGWELLPDPAVAEGEPDERGWQIQRAVAAYDALCRAAELNRDLIVVGY